MGFRIPITGVVVGGGDGLRCDGGVCGLASTTCSVGDDAGCATIGPALDSEAGTDGPLSALGVDCGRELLKLSGTSGVRSSCCAGVALPS